MKVAYLVPTYSRGGGFVVVIRADGSGQHRSTLPGLPSFSPDGRKLAYAPETGDHARLHIADRRGRGRRLLTQAKTCFGPVWSPDSTRLLYTNDCDLDSQRIGVVSADGSGERLLTGAWCGFPAWSPDGRSILFTRIRPSRRLFLMDAQSGKQKPVAGRYPAPEPSSSPTWSPDGRRIFFLAYGADKQVYAINRDGSGGRNLTASLPRVRDFELSPDGRKLALTAPGTPDRGWEIYTVDTDGSGLRQLTHNRGAHDVGPSWSPDGGKIAFSSNRGGNWKLYVMNADGSSQIKLGNRSLEADDFVWLPADSPL